MVHEWYDDAIKTIETCRERVLRMDGPVVQEDLVAVLRLSKEIVRVYELDGH